MKRATLAAVLFAVGLASCGGEEAAPSAEAPPPAEAGCAEGFAPDASGICVEVVPSEACRPGTRPRIGATSCEPVGWTTACPLGMKADPSGWGCVDARVEPCGDLTRESVSSGRCVPIGDCNAAFPPAGAIVVDAALDDAEVDATHFKTIQAAVTAAPAGATIAIAAGSYAEHVKIDKTLTLEGRCPRDVKLTPASTTEPGILVEKAVDVVIRGIHVTGPHIGGIDVYTGSQATIEEVVIDGAKLWGVIVDASSATIKRSKVAATVLGPDASGREVKGGWGIAAGASNVSIDDVNVVGGSDALFAGTTDTQMSVSRLVASGQAPLPPSRAAGVYARSGRITLERSIFHDITGDGAIMAELPKAIVEVRDTVVRDVKVGGGSRGYGAVAFAGGEVTLRSVAILGAESVGLLARDGGSILSAYDTVVRGPASSGARPDEDLVVTSERAGIGAQAVGKGKLHLENVAFVEAWGWGVYADTGAEVEMLHSLVDGTRALEPTGTVLPFAIGLSVGGASATTTDVSILRSTLHGITVGRKGRVSGSAVYVRDVSPSDPRGVGAGAAIAAGEAGQVDLDASAIFESTTSGILALEGAGSRVRLTRSTVHGTRAAPQGFGHGVIVAGEAEVVLEGSSVFDNAGVAIAASGGRAHLVSSIVARNPIALHMQHGSFLVESAADGELEATEVRISPDSRFVDNATKVGTGELPLPNNVMP